MKCGKIFKVNVFYYVECKENNKTENKIGIKT